MEPSASCGNATNVNRSLRAELSQKVSNNYDDHPSNPRGWNMGSVRFYICLPHLLLRRPLPKLIFCSFVAFVVPSPSLVNCVPSPSFGLYVKPRPSHRSHLRSPLPSQTGQVSFSPLVIKPRPRQVVHDCHTSTSPRPVHPGQDIGYPFLLPPQLLHVSRVSSLIFPNASLPLPLTTPLPLHVLHHGVIWPLPPHLPHLR